MPKQSAYVTIAIMLVIIAGTILWGRSAHRPTEAIQVAQDFLKKIDAGQLTQAFELTVKQGYMGRTPDEFRKISELQVLCQANRVAYTFPFQSNGNRLRRFVSGREVEEPRIHIEFEGKKCPIRVSLSRTKNNEWRIYGFGSHAG